VFRVVKSRQCVHISRRRGETRGARGGSRGRIVDLASGRISRPRKPAELRRPLPTATENPNPLDRFAGPGVDWGLRLEQRQNALSAIGGPKSDETAFILAQGHGVNLIAAISPVLRPAHCEVG
jgi:hypothetical protein